MFELSQSFYFDAAHSLRRGTDVGVEETSSRRVHGHSYRAEVMLRGEADPNTGMLVDLGVVRTAIATVHERLDHQNLDEVEGLGTPTLENLCLFIHRELAHLPALFGVSVSRDSSGDRCVYRPTMATAHHDEPTTARPRSQALTTQP
jgi:6-pyruvoyltetrahydropterin/6-carboxytetrahydropterin synthase